LVKTGPHLSSPVGRVIQPTFRYLPVPVSVEVCGLPAALSLTCKVPGLVPVCVGVNVTLIVHLAFAARLEPQVVAEML